jgi:hypothetical protein
MTTTRRASLGAALTIAALAFAACGGSTASTDTGAEPAASEAAPTTAPSEGSAESTEPSLGALPSFDLSGLIQNLEGVDSYRVAISTNGETGYEAVVVTKPELARSVMLQDGTRIVVIGDEAWMGQGDALQPVPGDLASSMLLAFDPTLLVGAFAAPGAMAGANEIGTEEKNGVQTKHFRIDADSFVGGIASMPPGSAIDLWIAEEGYLVSLSVQGIEGQDFTMDVSGVNDPANVVERPS